MIPVVRTTQKDWLERALRFYAKKEKFSLIDDAKLNLTSDDLVSAVTLIKAVKDKSDLSWSQIVAVLAGIGITGAGVWIIGAAIADPEPTSKLGLLITGGIVLALTGSLGTLAALGVRVSIRVKSLNGEWVIEPKR